MSAISTLLGDLAKNTGQAIMLAMVTAQSAESVEQPLHSVILKIMTNYMVAVQVLSQFDISKIEKQPWVVEAEKRQAAMDGVEMPDVKIEIPSWANDFKDSLATLSPAVPAFGVEEVIGCLIPGRIDRYYARAMFHFLSPAINLIYTTVLCGFFFMFRKQIAKCVAHTWHEEEEEERRRARIGGS
jgi:hypothetical protein